MQEIILTKSEEKELIVKYRNNDKDAQNTLIEYYLPLVKSIAYNRIKNHAKGIDVNDVIQEGLIGFNDAVFQYEEEKGYPLKALAAVCISRRIISYLRYLHKGYNIWNTIPEAITVNEDEPISIFDTIGKNDNYPMDLDWLLSSLTKDEIRLLDLRIKGYKYVEIAKQLDINEKSIHYIIRKIIRKLRRITEMQEDNYIQKETKEYLDEIELKVYNLRMIKKKYKEIAKELNISVKEVNNIMQRIRRKIGNI